MRWFIFIVSCFASIGCIQSDITVINETSYEADPADAIAMAIRACPSCGGLRIRLMDREETDTLGAESKSGPARVFEARAVYTGCIATSGLAHELIHWRLQQMTGDGDTLHTAIDWNLQSVLESEFACEDSGEEKLDA